MKVNFLYQGLVIGFAIAAPVGPIGVLCIRRTLSDGRVSGLVSGLGAATADAFYGCVAGFGLTAISSLLLNYQDWLRLAGGLFLFYLAAKTFLAKPGEPGPGIPASDLVKAYASTLALTLTNPATIVSFIWVFAGMGLGSRKDYTAAGLLVLGVFVGSAFWWLLLSTGVGWFRDRFDARKLAWVNRISGLIIAGFGLLAWLSLKK